MQFESFIGLASHYGLCSTDIVKERVILYICCYIFASPKAG